MQHVVELHKELNDVDDIRRVLAVQVRAANQGCGGHRFFPLPYCSLILLPRQSRIACDGMKPRR
jgi:hypothetical protein